ncbi:hypothetical protein [Gallaecimonas xiamenensis]|uniref:Uncharacterized protein n=1 Tax=Gallaecimonas xiamenensis 3-C-1 TaxID=745411 RepID=K2K3I5_9GAMM|nr:hypothetical protein [Gallaecimonas xiamenensis]EKE77524.1 hypothetical protein B3C1_01895 [Gallaecimonas xiamenensis 3-C-1]
MKLRNLLAAVLALGSSSTFAAGMSCYLDTAAYDEFTPNYCTEILWNKGSATAVFRIDNVPERFYIDWHNPKCESNATTCSAVIRVFEEYQATATLIDLTAGTVTEVSATAYFEDGR